MGDNIWDNCKECSSIFRKKFFCCLLDKEDEVKHYKKMNTVNYVAVALHSAIGLGNLINLGYMLNGEDMDMSRASLSGLSLLINVGAILWHGRSTGKNSTKIHGLEMDLVGLK